jgi:hypothetical protein
MTYVPIGFSTKLPAIEAYVIKGAPQEKEKFSDFIDNAREWWASWGFEFIFDSFISTAPTESERILKAYSWAKFSRSSLAVPHRVIILEDALLVSQDLSMYSRGKDEFVTEQINQYGMAITPVVVLWQLLLVMRKKVSKLNYSALKLMRVHWWTWFRPKMRQHIKLNNELQRESMLLDRLNIEWERKMKESEKWPLRALDWEQLESMKAVRHERAGKQTNLKELSIGEINEHVQSLDQQLTHLRRWHSQHLINKNAWVSFGLAIIVLLATIIGLIQIIPLVEKALRLYFAK